ncbi:MAG: phosphomannose isomerase type II C-terminal cupin domain [Patescibacteria group bacterium]|nr:phosphomannose isomerase type II C-terminal cupin domain [Patescibacteria group bacterium]
MLLNYSKEDRPWGSFERFTLNEPTTVKLVHVKAGEAISLQTHTGRDEFWRIVEGTGTVTIGAERHEATVGSEFFAPRGSAHRVEAVRDLTLLEISFGAFDEGDITRLKDKYHR